MKIYTRTGDRGDTALFGGQRVPKDALRVEAYGTIDELNSVLGIVLADNNDPEIEMFLRPVQSLLFDLGAALATPRSAGRRKVRRIEASDAAGLETLIDRFDARLEPLKAFILPGGSALAARLHFARTVCRRAERICVRLTRNEDIGDAVTMLLNRLSDLLFVLARYSNVRANSPEIQWKSNTREEHQ
ncbi:MAG: cob(I)yrinic acid a,c-diamide adenosyltransferase [Acidobacteria bacterium]|nr:MAG: cob(I)yrinic acid a,c-diamide adenosyltransferase [Acidobacteriota bacterium]